MPRMHRLSRWQMWRKFRQWRSQAHSVSAVETYNIERSNCLQLFGMHGKLDGLRALEQFLRGGWSGSSWPGLETNKNLPWDSLEWMWANQIASRSVEATKINLTDDNRAETYFIRPNLNLLWRLVGRLFSIPQSTLCLRTRWHHTRAINQPFDKTVSGCPLCSHWPHCLTLDRHLEHLPWKDQFSSNVRTHKTNLVRRPPDSNEAYEHHFEKDGQRRTQNKWVCSEAVWQNQQLYGWIPWQQSDHAGIGRHCLWRGQCHVKWLR